MGYFVNAQITSDPEFPTATEPITIYFDATGTGLEGYNDDVYAHTGVHLSDGSEWQYVIGSWGNNTTQPQLTFISDDYYSLEITPDANTFYGVPSSETITQLAIVFRSADGSQQSSDLFLDIFTLSNEVIITAPDSTDIFSIGDDVTIQAVAMFADSIKLFMNEVLIEKVENTILETQVPATVEGKTYFTVIAKNDTEADTVTSYFFVRKDNVIADLPVEVEYGINYIDDNTVTLALHAPSKEFVFLKGDFNNWDLDLDYQMNITPNGEVYWFTLENLTAGEEYAFQYYVDGERSVADPYADKILDPWNDQYIDDVTYPDLKPYPDGGEGIVSVFQTAQTPYTWTVENFDRPDKGNLIVYELHIRDFIAAHDYQTMIDTIGYLKNLGINAIELMPINEFEGNSSWGYNPSFYFAVDKYYGTKDKLKEFIDVCHQNDIAVIIDMVYNHSYGQSPLVLLYVNDSWEISAENPWYNVESPNPVYYWGFDFNHESQATVDFVDRNLEYWLTEFKVDGFRLDFTKGFTNTPGDGWAYDQARIDILKSYYDVTQTAAPGSYLILEHLADNSEETVLANYGMMLWGNLNHSYGEASMGYIDGSDFSWISYQERGWNNPHVVGYMESHDEERMMFRNLQYGNSQGEYNITDMETALQRAELAATFFFTIPGPKMIWEFEELGYDVSIDTPCRVCDKPILWEYYENYHRNRVYNVFGTLIKLKRDYSVFSTENFSIDASGSVKEIILEGDTMDIYVIGNFDMTNKTKTLNFPESGTWYEYFTGGTESSGTSISLTPGEYRLYSSKQLPTPDIPELSMPPIVSNLNISGNLFIFDTLVASYTFYDANEDLEAESQYQWFISDYSDGLGKVEIENETSKTYNIRQEDLGRYIGFEVTPLANSTQEAEGETKKSGFLGPIKFEKTDEVEIFPNPFTDILNFVNTSDYENLYISDIKGQMIYQQEILRDVSISLNFQSLQEGIYIVKLTNDEKEMEFKIVKMPN